MTISAQPTAYDSTDLERTDLSLYLEIVEGLYGPPDVRGKDSIVPHLAGAIARNRKGNSRRLILKGWVAGVDTTEALARAHYQNTMDELAILFATDRAPANVVVTAADSTTRTIAARPLNWIITKETVPGLAAELSVELLSVAPNWTVT